MPTTYNKEREYIGEIAYMSKPHQFCSIVGLYGLASSTLDAQGKKITCGVLRNYLITMQLNCFCKNFFFSKSLLKKINYFVPEIRPANWNSFSNHRRNQK